MVSVAANNNTSGFAVQTDSSHAVSNLSLTRVQGSANQNGIEASGTGATLWLDNRQ
jgi:hypothetical protein